MPLPNTSKAFYFICVLSMLTMTGMAESSELSFALNIASVDYKTAKFELVDDNSTATNYLIKYDITSMDQYVAENGIPISEKDHSSNTLEVQTNSKTFFTNNQTTKVDFTFWDNGVQLTPEEMDSIQSKSAQEQHCFEIDTLDENRVYVVIFSVIASVAQRGVFKSEPFFDARRTVKKFRLQFRTRYDVPSAAQAQCKSQLEYEADGLIEPLKSSCYLIASNCTQCTPDCYQVRGLDDKDEKGSVNGPILCQRCPCDRSKSTGECTVTEDDSNVFNPQLKFKCTQCSGPFVGDLCDRCKGEGFELFRDEKGKCQTCQCSGNSLYDNTDFNGHTGKVKRKCAPITGKCLNCLFNTAGPTCNLCKDGYHGDPLKRTCTLMTTNKQADGKLINQTSRESKTYMKNTFNSKLFIFVYLLMIVFTFLFFYALCIRNNDEPVLKDNFNGRCSSCFKSLSDSTRNKMSRASIYLSSYIPFVSYKQHQRINQINELNADFENDDDRLNLAEYQVCNDSTTFDSVNNKNRGDFSDADDEVMRKSPYRVLTVKC